MLLIAATGSKMTSAGMESVVTDGRYAVTVVRVDGLDTRERVREVRSYERTHKNRAGVIRAEASSAAASVLRIMIISPDRSC